MNKVGVWELDNVLQHPFKHSNVSETDVLVDLLQRKLCPVHLTPLTLQQEITLHDGQYIRKRYGCRLCHCEADFVGDELKGDSVGRTIEFVNLMINEAKKFRQKPNPEEMDGVKI